MRELAVRVNLLIHYAKGTRNFAAPLTRLPVLFQPFSSRFFSSFPHGTLRYRSSLVSFLEGGPPLFKQKSLYSVLLKF